jgi:hypothetical protein
VLPIFRPAEDVKDGNRLQVLEPPARNNRTLGTPLSAIMARRKCLSGAPRVRPASPYASPEAFVKFLR